jgi:hypothetical protein
MIINNTLQRDRQIAGLNLKSLFLSLCLAVIWIASAATAVYANPIIYICDSNGNLGTVDTTNGTTHVIGNMGRVMTDIAFDHNGNLYAIDFSSLYKINQNNAAATLIGKLGIADANALVFAPDGTLYTAGSSTPRLYTVNTNTGSATSKGIIGTGITSYGDLEFNGGQLYLASGNGKLLNINLTNTAQSTELGFMGFSNVWGLATGDNGVLYGAANTQIMALNTATGAGTFILNYSGQGLSNAMGAATLKTTAPTTTNIECLFNWAQSTYPSLFSPRLSGLQYFLSFTYRHYTDTNNYVGVSSIDNHVYYQGPDNILRDLDDVSGWLILSNCQNGNVIQNTGSTQTGGTSQTGGSTTCTTCKR